MVRRTIDRSTSNKGAIYEESEAYFGTGRRCCAVVETASALRAVTEPLSDCHRGTRMVVPQNTNG